MPKVKIVLSHEYSTDDYSTSVMGGGICDWEEITQEEVRFLRANLHKIDFGYGHNLSPVVIVQDEMKVMERIDSIKAVIAKEQENQRRTKEEEERRKREKALKRQAKTEAEEKALLATLEEKYRKGQ